ncbi:MAG: hypothetical protein PHO64_12080, partial [Thiomonas sp.]|nr:hypothetical protein [Thiomonas sp.]
MKPLKFIPLALVAALSACHQGGVGVDSGASQKAATTAENSLGSDRAIHAMTAAQAAVQMPAAGLIIAALADWGERTVDAYIPSPAGGRLWQTMLDSTHGNHGPAQLGRLFGAAAQGFKSPSKNYQHAAAAVFIVQTAQPCTGWPIGGFGNPKQAAWARAQAQDVAFSNLVLTQIAATPALRDALADPGAAHKAIIAAFLKITPAQIDAAWQQAAQASAGPLTFDFSGSQP